MKLNQPQYYLWGTAILVLITGFINFDSDSAIDINVHDTYFVIHHFAIAELITLYLLFAGFLYWIYQKANLKLNAHLTKTHLILTVGGILLYFVLSGLFQRNEQADYKTFNITISILILVILFGQLLFILNLILGLFRRITNHQ